MPDPLVLSIEKQVAHAHRALWHAQQLAEQLPDPGLNSDLFLLCTELQRVQESLLKGTRGVRVRVSIPQ